MKRSILLGILLAGLVAGLGYAYQDETVRYFFKPTYSTLDSGREIQGEETVVIARDLQIPWEIAVLPSGELLATERPGTLARVNGDTVQRIEVPGARHQGEGGLLGLALHPDFADNKLLYLYLTSTSEQGDLENRVEQYEFDGNTLSERRIILNGIPAGSFHNGGRIAFGPDGYLYVTTGDAGESSLAQDTNSLAGKILRLTDEGEIPEDNPFENPVYSYGHRNPQGLAWDSEGHLWSTEHGRSGIRSGLDELNRIEKGANYGWPEIQGDESLPGMEHPVIHSGPDETWAPGGMAYHDGSLWFAGLRGESLYEAELSESERDVFALRSYLRSEYGRLRAVAKDADGNLYVSTSNTDGRGRIQSGDDKILRIPPSLFAI